MDYTIEKEKWLQEIKDLCKLKGFSRQTSKSYCYHVGKYVDFIEKSRLNLENSSVKSYLLVQDLSVNSVRIKYAAIGFFFREILKKPFTTEEVPIKKKEKSLPKLLSKEQIKKLIEGTDNLKHRLIVKLLYSSGLRLSELLNLKRKDIDFDRGVINVRLGKGKKDRISLISENVTSSSP